MKKQMKIFPKKMLSIEAIKIKQPVGEFFIGSMKFSDLIDISYADVREIENDLDMYLGIQRKLSKKRVSDLQFYVNTFDASFPTSIILAVEEDCAEWDDVNKLLILKSTEDVSYDSIAKILDGQHRIEGLKGFRENEFDINVSIFVGADIAEQANIFATVNLSQTKVNKSLAYDLFDYSISRSPQKTAHDVTVALDQFEDSPFRHRIKRLGFKTAGRDFETLTQATVVEAIMKYISINPMDDRHILISGGKISLANTDTLEKLPFRNLFIQKNDVYITKILLAFFDAVKEKWPKAWSGKESGQILPKTNGFKALMRFFLPAYRGILNKNNLKIGDVITTQMVFELLESIPLEDSDFNTDNFKPGSSGEGELFSRLITGSNLLK